MPAGCDAQRFRRRRTRVTHWGDTFWLVLYGAALALLHHHYTVAYIKDIREEVHSELREQREFIRHRIRELREEVRGPADAIREDVRSLGRPMNRPTPRP